jgi:hypothetical protein
MWKKILSTILVIAFISLFTLNSAEAGSKQHDNVWSGAGIALGAVALGAMAFGLFTHTPPPQPPQWGYYPPPEPRAPSPPPLPEYVPGHWETSRDWISGTWEKVWIPGYYDRRGNWVAGHYEKRQTPGRYVDRSVWVEGHYRYN